MFTDSDLTSLASAAKLGGMTAKEQIRLVKEYRAVRGNYACLHSLLWQIKIDTTEALEDVEDKEEDDA